MQVVLHNICNLWVFSNDLEKKIPHDHAGQVINTKEGIFRDEKF